MSMNKANKVYYNVLNELLNTRTIYRGRQKSASTKKMTKNKLQCEKGITVFEKK